MALLWSVLKLIDARFDYNVTIWAGSMSTMVVFSRQHIIYRHGHPHHFWPYYRTASVCTSIIEVLRVLRRRRRFMQVFYITIVPCFEHDTQKQLGGKEQDWHPRHDFNVKDSKLREFVLLVTESSPRIRSVNRLAARHVASLVRLALNKHGGVSFLVTIEED